MRTSAPAVRATRLMSDQFPRAHGIYGYHGLVAAWARRRPRAVDERGDGLPSHSPAHSPPADPEGQAYQAAMEAARSLPGAEEHSRQAIELAERHGRSDETAAGVAYTALGGALAWRGRLDEAATWLHRADLAIKPEAEAVAALGVQYVRGQILLAHGQAADALWFLLHPVPEQLERLMRRRTAHVGGIAPPRTPARLTAPMSESELRVLRYLPTNLTVPEIAGELFVSSNTVKTHVRNVYAKLGSHRRTEAVERARDLGLLAPSAASLSQPS
jgi:LuxR family transcriptional regulator, maltose regulon positive regulatory protein